MKNIPCIDYEVALRKRSSLALQIAQLSLYSYTRKTRKYEANILHISPCRQLF
jgi:hypothetical protein